jgi:hypothetical protein
MRCNAHQMPKNFVILGLIHRTSYTTDAA